jgi:NADH:ubiquinone oxidoreductase subunit E
MTTPMNITFEILDNKLSKNLTPVTFYHIDAITRDGKHAIIISGGKEWCASVTYEEVWDKLKRHIDASTTRK